MAPVAVILASYCREHVPKDPIDCLKHPASELVPLEVAIVHEVGSLRPPHAHGAFYSVLRRIQSDLVRRDNRSTCSTSSTSPGCAARRSDDPRARTWWI